VRVPVLFPQHHQIDAGPLQLARERRPIRLAPPAQSLPHAGSRKQALLENGISDLGRQGPPQAGRLSPLEVVLDGRSRDAQRSPNLARAHPVAGKAQHLS